MAKEDTNLFNEQFNKKLPFLLVALVFFLLSMYTFIATGFTFSSLFDFGSFASNPTQLLSAQVIIFTAMFAVAVSFTAFFGFGLTRMQAAIPGAAFTLIALLTFAVLPSYALLFLAFALCFGAGSIIASMQKEVNFESLSLATRRALTVFLALVILFSIIKVETNKEAYLDQFLLGAASLSPQLAQQVLPLCSQPFSKVNPEEVVPRSATDLQTQSNYETYRTAIAASATTCTIPTFAELNETTQDSLREDQHVATVQSVRQLLRGLTEQLNSPEVQAELTNFKVSKAELEELRSQLRQISYFQLVETYFSLFIAFILFSLVSAFTWVTKLINYVLNYALLQVSKLQIEAKE